MKIRSLKTIVAALIFTLHSEAAEIRWHANLLKKSDSWFASEEARAVAGSALQHQSTQLKTQVKQAVKPTAWCAQYDERTLQPTWASSFEPPCLASSESVGVIRFLMALDIPTPEVRARLQAAYDTWAAPLPKALWDVERDPAKGPARKAKAKAAQ